MNFFFQLIEESSAEEDEVRKDHISEKSFRNLLYLRSLQALVEPGEAVGLTAAQVRQNRFHVLLT